MSRAEPTVAKGPLRDCCPTHYERPHADGCSLGGERHPYWCKCSRICGGDQ